MGTHMSLERCSIALAQLNTCVGDIEGNAQKIVQAVIQARRGGATMLLTPELSLCGYPPQDFLFREDFLQACSARLVSLAAELADVAPQMAVIVGYPEAVESDSSEPFGLPRAYNSAVVLFQGRKVACHRKQILPGYGVFDELRVFKSGNTATVFEFHGYHFGLLVCEDVWTSVVVDDCVGKGADVLLVINASPWHRGKKIERLAVLQKAAQRAQKAIVYCNQVGAQDELIFDGASCVLDSKGEVKQQLPSFAAAISLIEFQERQPMRAHNPLAFENVMNHADNVLNDLYQALCLGVKDYVQKNGFCNVLLGLSGGGGFCAHFGNCCRCIR